MNATHSRKNKVGALIGLISGLVLLCVTVSIITLYFLPDGGDWKHHDEANGHNWLHQELNLTPGEAAAIDAFEPEYRRERAALQSRFQSKTEELRREIVTSDEYSQTAQETIHELHVIHGQLQELSIRHYYQMMHVLPAEKQDRLRDIAAEALSVPQ
jgi:Spy/CpxP family protein refolding chaperone